MKIRIEIEEGIEEEEVVIRCRELSDEVVTLQRQIGDKLNSKMQIEVSKRDITYYLTLDEIYFLETEENLVAVHTAADTAMPMRTIKRCRISRKGRRPFFRSWSEGF